MQGTEALVKIAGLSVTLNGGSELAVVRLFRLSLEVLRQDMFVVVKQLPRIGGSRRRGRRGRRRRGLDFGSRAISCPRSLPLPGKPATRPGKGARASGGKS